VSNRLICSGRRRRRVWRFAGARRRGDPAEIGSSLVESRSAGDAGGGDQASVADQYQSRARRCRGSPRRYRVKRPGRRCACEHPHRDRTAVGVGEQPDSICARPSSRRAEKIAARGKLTAPAVTTPRVRANRANPRRMSLNGARCMVAKSSRAVWRQQVRESPQ